jgi:ABC-2 type transport system permease protein
MVISLYVAALKEYLRDRTTLFWTLAFPILFIVLFGLIYTRGGGNQYNVAIVNLDSGTTGQQIVNVFQNKDLQQIFKVTNGTSVDQENTYQDQLKSGNLDMVIVIPPGLSQNASSNQTSQVQLYYDASKQPSGQIMLGVVQNVLDGINQEVTGKAPLLQLQTQSVNTATLTSIDFLVPGILAMSLLQLGLFGTTLPLVSLRERKILRRLGATPMPRWALLASQVLLRLTITLIQTALILGIGAYAFGVQIVHPLATAGIIVLSAVMCISLGYLLASIAKTQESASAITQAINFPMMFLTGIFFPLAFLPAFLDAVVKALPLTYIADAMRQTMINSTPSFPLLTDVGVIAAWAIGCGLLSARLFRWE